jgi:hypothetical protein
LNHKKLDLEKIINEEHSKLIQKTIHIRELEQKINEMENKKAKGDALVCHKQANIEVGYYNWIIFISYF